MTPLSTISQQKPFNVFNSSNENTKEFLFCFHAFFFSFIFELYKNNNIKKKFFSFFFLVNVKLIKMFACLK